MKNYNLREKFGYLDTSNILITSTVRDHIYHLFIKSWLYLSINLIWNEHTISITVSIFIIFLYLFVLLAYFVYQWNPKNSLYLIVSFVATMQNVRSCPLDDDAEKIMTTSYSSEPYNSERLSQLPGGYTPLTQPHRLLTINFDNPTQVT